MKKEAHKKSEQSQKSTEGLTVKKDENFSDWYSQIIEKAEIVDLRLDVKGFMVFRPWGTMIIENMIKLYEKELQARGHKPTFMPSVIPEENLMKEASHLEGFTPEVFWLKPIGKENLALRPTSETLYTPMFKLWIRSWRDLPMKLYQRGSVFRLDTKATRPLIRTREIIWIEAHDAFASKSEAEAQVQEDIDITEKIMHNKFGIPFFPMKRPSWDKFAGAEYTVGSDVMMPDGKLIQQPSTHLMGQKFSKAFGAKFKKEDETEDYIWQTAYGPAFSRILVSVISQHGDDKGLVLPFCLAPTQVMIVPIFNKENKEKVLRETIKIKEKIDESGIKVEIDAREEKRPGEKFYEWELKGVPFRLEIGEKEIESKSLTLFSRESGNKEKLPISKLSILSKLGEEYDLNLIKKADSLMKDKIVNCKDKDDLKKAMDKGKIARINFCSTDKEGTECANIIEKEMNAEVRGTLANKNEKPEGKCIICKEKANAIAYVGRSY